MQSLKDMDLLRITNRSGFPQWAPNQEWFGSFWQRKSGCGPTTCATQLWYLSRTRAHYAALCPHDASQRAGMTALMEDVWPYVRPGIQGLNKISTYAEGAAKYAADKGIALQDAQLPIPRASASRPDADDTLRFILGGIGRNTTVAFLNLHAGSIRPLESWHWVTVAGANPASREILVLDNGHSFSMRLDTWLASSREGGGFVYLQ